MDLENCLLTLHSLQFQGSRLVFLVEQVSIVQLNVLIEYLLMCVCAQRMYDCSPACSLGDRNPTEFDLKYMLKQLKTD